MQIVSFCPENGTAAYHRKIVQGGDRHRLRQAAASYTRHFGVEMTDLRADSMVFQMDLSEIQ